MIPESIRSLFLPPYDMVAFEEALSDSFSPYTMLGYYQGIVRSAQNASPLFKTLQVDCYYVVLRTTQDNTDIVKGSDFIFFMGQLAPMIRMVTRLSQEFPFEDRMLSETTRDTWTKSMSKHGKLTDQHYQELAFLTYNMVHEYCVRLANLRMLSDVPRSALVALEEKIQVSCCIQLEAIKTAKEEGRKRLHVSILAEKERKLEMLRALLKSKY